MRVCNREHLLNRNKIRSTFPGRVGSEEKHVGDTYSSTVRVCVNAEKNTWNQTPRTCPPVVTSGRRVVLFWEENTQRYLFSKVSAWIHSKK